MTLRVHVLIGGPKAGTLYSTPLHVPFINFAEMPEMPSLAEIKPEDPMPDAVVHTYVRRRLVTPQGREVTFFAHDSMDHEESVVWLLGYYIDEKANR